LSTIGLQAYSLKFCPQPILILNLVLNLIERVRMMSENTPGKMYDEAMKLKNEGNLEGCVEALKHILTVDPNHVQTHMALGVHQQKLGRPEEAIHHAKMVTELEPTDAFSFTQLSVIYQRCGKILEAEDAMAKAREIQGAPKNH